MVHLKLDKFIIPHMNRKISRIHGRFVDFHDDEIEFDT